jgi:HK97 family phage major capsid protein
VFAQEAIAPMPTALDSTSFEGFVARDELSTFIANSAVSGAPFARAITPLPTSRGGVTFPVVNPTGFDWVPEGGTIPDVDLGDEAYSIAVAKLAGLITSSNEFVDDNELPIEPLLAQAVQDAMSPTLDVGLLFGSGAGGQPEGVMDHAVEAVGGADWRADVIGAWGELVDRGADPESIVAFASASVIAWELSRTNDQGTPIHADGAAGLIGPNIRLIAVPSLSAGQTLVADRSRLYLVLRNDFIAEASAHAKFSTDQSVIRVKGRFACACPTPEKALRKITSPS